MSHNSAYHDLERHDGGLLGDRHLPPLAVLLHGAQALRLARTVRLLCRRRLRLVRTANTDSDIRRLPVGFPARVVSTRSRTRSQSPLPSLSTVYTDWDFMPISLLL